MNTATIYRSGRFEISSYAGYSNLLDLSQEFDAYRDDRHPVGRCGALFASPTLHGVTRWTKANMLNLREKRTAETFAFTVNADTTLVYNLELWEDYCCGIQSAAEEYWNTTQTLTDWLAEGNLENRGLSHEILFTVENMLSEPKQVIPQQLVEAYGDQAGRRHFVDNVDRLM